MAAAVRTRNAYRPVSVEDTGQENLLRTESQSPVTKPRHGISLCVFLIFMVGLCIVFLLGFCLGFYVNKSQTQSSVKDILADCLGDVEPEEVEEPLSLTGIHDDMMYRVRGEDLRLFMEEFNYEDPVSGSLVEKKLAQRVRQSLQDTMVDSFEVEEHDVVVTYCDPQRPNSLQILRKDDNTVTNLTLANDMQRGPSETKTNSHVTTDHWKYPFVVHSPAATVEGGLVYGHYGSETDLLILQERRVSMKDRVVLLRLGKTSLAEKVRDVAQLGAVGVLVYWDPVDTDNTTSPPSPSLIPYASAAIYSTDLPQALVPTIPVQTVSVEIAEQLLQHLQEEEGALYGPAAWAGRLNSDYPIGTRSSGGNLTVRLSTFNKEKRQIVRNFISHIHGTVEKDRYVVVGAARASLPGVWQDVLASTGALLQLSKALHTAYTLKKWHPRRGIRIISWGGADIGGRGMLQHLKTHHHLLSQRATAYVDVGSLVKGHDVLTARVSPGLYQVLTEVTTLVPDPSQPEHSIQESWQEALQLGKTPEPSVIPLASYRGDWSEAPFLHVLGVSTVSLQYRDRRREGDLGPREYEGRHHYKFHAAAVRVMLQVVLSMGDDNMVPFSLSAAARHLTASLTATSNTLKACSRAMHDLDAAVKLGQELQGTAEMFEELIQVYRERQYEQGFRMASDVKMLFERLFISRSNGVPHHVLYPEDREGGLSYARQLCELGDTPEMWDAVQRLSDTLTAILTEAIGALRTTN